MQENAAYGLKPCKFCVYTVKNRKNLYKTPIKMVIPLDVL